MPREIPLPPGVHHLHDNGFSRDFERNIVRLGFLRYAEDFEVDSYLDGYADSSTSFRVDGAQVDMDTALAALSVYWGEITVTATEPGRVDAMEFATRRGRQSPKAATRGTEA